MGICNLNFIDYYRDRSSLRQTSADSTDMRFKFPLFAKKQYGFNSYGQFNGNNFPIFPVINFALAQSRQKINTYNNYNSVIPNYALNFNKFCDSYSFSTGNIVGVTAKQDKNSNNAQIPSISLNLSDEQLTTYGFDTKEKREGFRSLKPEMQRAVIKLTEYAKSEGIEIRYKSKRSIFRTYSEQAAIYKTARKGYAARPGSSRHETGEAVDITIPGANSSNKNDPKFKKLGEYWQSMGYTWGGTWNHCEPWHFDLRACA